MRRHRAAPWCRLVEALTHAVEQAEVDEAFHREADARWATLLADDKSVPLDHARAWLEARARGERVAKPEARGSVF